MKKINDLTTFGVHLDVHIDYFIADVLLLQCKIVLSKYLSLIIHLYNNHVNHSYYEQPTTSKALPKHNQIYNKLLKRATCYILQFVTFEV